MALLHSYRKRSAVRRLLLIPSGMKLSTGGATTEKESSSAQDVYRRCVAVVLIPCAMPVMPIHASLAMTVKVAVSTSSLRRHRAKDLWQNRQLQPLSIPLNMTAMRNQPIQIPRLTPILEQVQHIPTSLLQLYSLIFRSYGANIRRTSTRAVSE